MRKYTVALLEDSLLIFEKFLILVFFLIVVSLGILNSYLKHGSLLTQNIILVQMFEDILHSILLAFPNNPYSSLLCHFLQDLVTKTVR